MSKIKQISAHKIINSRGDWTVDAAVELEDGTRVEQPVPEGASKGELEGVSVSVDKAVENVNSIMNDALKGKNSEDQLEIDEILVKLDGTENKSNLGVNSILPVSLGIAKASAASKKVELFQYISKIFNGKEIKKDNIKYPTPVFNVINGGKHAPNDLSFQEFMVIPATHLGYEKSVIAGVSIYDSLDKILKDEGYDTGVGDEGGFAPKGLTTSKALGFIKKACIEWFEPGKDVFFGMDVAAGSFYKGGRYSIIEEDISLNSEELVEYYSKLLKDFEIIYLEDPFYEKDIEGWKKAYELFSSKLALVGDDLVVTNSDQLDKALKDNLVNAVIVKPNQIGTLTETLGFVKKAQENNLSICVSHRSGDTAEDTFIADLAIAVGAEFMKAGAPARGERVSKYNRILDIIYSIV